MERPTEFVRSFLAVLVIHFLGGAPARAGEAAAWKVLPDSTAIAVVARAGLAARLRAAEGGGGAVGGLKVTQIAYSDEDQADGVPVNIILLEWQVSGGSDPITIYENGNIVTDTAGNPAVLAGTETSVLLFGGAGAVGQYTFMIESGGSTSSDDLFILTAQPFDDPATSCRGGLVNQQGTCDLLVTIDAARKPSFYLFAVDGGAASAQQIPGAATEHPISGLFPGQHCVTLLGFLVENGNDYAGDPVETCCDFQCTDLPCDPPALSSSCQHAFGPTEAECKVLVTWENGETDYAGIRLSIDGNPLEPLPGSATSADLALAPGEHVLRIEADCGERGASPAVDLPLTVVSEAPVVEAARNIACRFTTPDASTLLLTWTTVERPSEIEVYLVSPDDVRTQVKTLNGGATSTTIDGTTSADRAGLRFVYEQDGLCFSSDVMVCSPPPPPAFLFTLADCDASADLDLTDSVFSLNFLFRGGAPPPCEAACDSNLDSRFDLADPVYTLNYLFLGGPPPLGKRPECDETKPGDACSRSTCSS
jgi:hypothetical protein